MVLIQWFLMQEGENESVLRMRNLNNDLAVKIYAAVVNEDAVERNAVYIIPDVFQKCVYMIRKDMMTSHLLLYQVHVNKCNDGNI